MDMDRKRSRGHQQKPAIMHSVTELDKPLIITEGHMEIEAYRENMHTPLLEPIGNTSKRHLLC